MADEKFTPEEEKKIQEAVKNSIDASRQAEIDAEIRNRILDQQNNTPGYRYQS